MAINVKCPKCGEVLEAPDGSEGQEAECPACNSAITVPAKKIIIKSSKVAPSSIPAVPSVSQVPKAPSAPVSPAQLSVSPASSTNPVVPQTSGFAIASMVLGIIGISAGFFCCGPVFPSLAVILGHMSFSKISKNPTLYSGKGLAIAGLTMGYVGLVLWVIVTIIMGGMMASMGLVLDQMNKMMGVH
jgi:hypothetical protein